MRRGWRRLMLALLMLCVGAPVVAAQGSIVITDQGVALEFPERLTFKAHVESGAVIEQIVLEYGVDKLTCGQVTAKAFPDFKPGRSVDVAWTWEMLKSGSEPPGATIWYRWRVTDAAGNQGVSDERRVTWLDDQHKWQSGSRDQLTLHWYDAAPRFADDLLNSAIGSLHELATTTGVTPQAPINLYIYANSDDMRDAVLYEPGWTGGQAFSDSNIVIIGISAKQIEWGKRAEAHELTHLLVGHLTFSCLGSVPTWLNEGIAVYGEGGPDQPSRDRLQAAINHDELISLRALSGGFSEHADRADLSYAQSYSLVNFLITTYGRDKLIKLFGNLREGMKIDAALNDAYGFDVEGLEERWRTSVGAPVRRAENASATATPLPTPIPTVQPVSAVDLAPSAEASAALSAEASAVPATTPTTPPTPRLMMPHATATPDLPPARRVATTLIIGMPIVLVGLLAIVVGLRIKRRG